MISLRSSLLIAFPLVSIAIGDLKKVDFIKTKVRGRSITVPELTNAQALDYFDSDFLTGRASVMSYVRFADQSEGVFAASENSGQLRLIHSSRQIRTYFPKHGSQPHLSFPSGLTVHPDGTGYVLDRNQKTISKFRVFPNLEISYLTSLKFEPVYEFIQQSIAPNGTRYVFALTADGSLGIYDENLGFITGVDLHLFAPSGFLALKAGSFDSQKNAFPLLALKKNEKGWVDIGFTPSPVSFSIDETSMRYSSDDVIVDFSLNYQAENEFRVFALSGTGNILEFSRTGVLLERPIVSWEGGDLVANPILLWPNRISGCSENRFVPSCQSLLVSENFSRGGGLKKFDVVGNGGAYFHALKVEIKDLSPLEPNISKPSIRMNNLSATKVLYGFKLRYWVSKQEFPSQRILVDKYFANPPNVQAVAGCDPRNLNICYVEITYPEAVEVESGQMTNPDDLQFGVHFDQYYPGQWNKANDWSMSGVTAEWSETNKVTVYDMDGNLIFGLEPEITSAPQPPASTSSDVLSFEYFSDWQIESGPIQTISSPCTHGSKCIEFAGSGYRNLLSRPFSMTLPAATSANKLAVDFQIVDFQPGAQYWLGNLQLFLDSRERNLQNVYIGQVDLSSGINKQYFKYKWQLSNDIVAQLRAGISDLVVKFAVNTPVGAGPFRIDNISFEN